MIYLPGDLIPQCSSYAVRHQAHQGTLIVIGAAGDIFPRCKECGEKVRYETLAMSENATGQILAEHPEFHFPVLRNNQAQT